MNGIGVILAVMVILMGGAVLAADEGRVRMVVTEDGETVPCRVTIRDEKGEVQKVEGWPFFHDHFTCDGEVTLPLAVGAYDYRVERGCEFEGAAGRFVVEQGEVTEVAARVRRLADLASEGYYAGDIHVHRAVEEMELLMRAEDVYVAPTITWWNGANVWLGKALPTEPLQRYAGNRYCFILSGEDEREGGANMFFNMALPIDITWAEWTYPSGLRFVEELRWQKDLWVDVEKPFWWDMPVMLAHGYADSIGLANNHMGCGHMLDNEAWGKPRDQEAYPSPHGNGRWAQDIYYKVLNCGFRIPPSAGSASGVIHNPLGHNRVYVHLEQEEWGHADWWRGLKEGRCFVTNGPLLRVRANGKAPGEVFRGEGAVTLELAAVLHSREPVKEVEIVQDGEVVRRVAAAEGELDLGTVTFERSGWCLVRAIAEVTDTFCFASTAPFYVEVGDEPRTVRAEDVRFFVDWVNERRGQIAFDDEEEQREVVRYHDAAVRFWRELLNKAQ